jgi:hypothetical protein
MTPGSGFLLYAGCALLAIGAAMFLYHGFRAVTAPFGQRIDRLTKVLLALYPLGVGCKAVALGPLFFRYHLSDIGFPVFAAAMFFHPDEQAPEQSQMDYMLQWLRHRKITVVIGLVASYGYEAFTGVMWRVQHDVMAEVKLIGNFDWVDMANYTLGAAACYTLLIIWQRRVVVAQALESYQKATSKATDEAARHSQRPQRQRGPRNRPARGKKGKRR